MKKLTIHYKYLIGVILFTLVVALNSCTNDFLDAKPSTDLVTPQKLDDIKALLDNTDFVNQTGGLGQMGADEYVFVDYTAWQGTFTAMQRNAYIWAQDIYEGEPLVQDWNIPFTSIFYANNALQSLDEMNLPDSPDKDHVKGWALFVRAYAYHDLVRNFCLAYDPQTANTDLGLPIQKSPRINEIHPRATLKQTYNLIIEDLKEATRLLSSQFPQDNRNRPSKASAYALLARVYLMMNEYENAELSADASLAIYNKLIDYNTVSKTATTPFDRFNQETIFNAKQFSVHGITSNQPSNTAVTINPTIIASYHTDDLRLSIFFGINNQGKYYKKTGYFGGDFYPFHGLAVDEIYLIKSECLARRGQITESMSWLNDLLVKRFTNTKPYTAISAGNKEEAIATILEERKKELIWRGIRWSDIKRLNKIGANITLKRILNGKEYYLSPNNLKYAFPIPDVEIARSKIEQNPR
jgi:hypothetical protein